MITESDRISYHESAPKVYKKIKLYADENIRYRIVLALRLQGINIKHASEVNLAVRTIKFIFNMLKGQTGGY